MSVSRMQSLNTAGNQVILQYQNVKAQYYKKSSKIAVPELKLHYCKKLSKFMVPECKARILQGTK